MTFALLVNRQDDKNAAVSFTSDEATRDVTFATAGVWTTPGLGLLRAARA